MSGLFTGIDRLPQIAKEHDCSTEEAGKIWMNSFLTPELQRLKERHAYCIARIAKWLNTSEWRAEQILLTGNRDAMAMFHVGNKIPRNELN